MIYQNPQLLYALFAIAIPILIHLFNFRKHKNIYFSSIRYLKEIKEDSRNKSTLKNILILISRILAISFLVIGFAKPYIPANNKKITNNIFLYIDNSQSMDIDFGNGNLLNTAKNNALQICEAYTSENNFYLIENDFLSKYITSYSIDEIKSQIDKIKPTSKQRNIIDIISRINSIKASYNHLYFISDFQENTLGINELINYKINNKVSLIPIENSNLSNINIDSVFTSVPIYTSENEAEVTTIISNSSNKDIKDEVLFLYIDEKQKSQQYLNLLANETKEIKFKFLTSNNKFITGEIRTHDSPITFDNNFFFTIKKLEKINVTVINKKNENKAFKSLFAKDTSLFKFTSITAKDINNNRLSQQDFIILNEVEEISSGLLYNLQSFTINGGSILIVPPSDLVKLNSYNTLLKSFEVNTITNKSEIKLNINNFSTKHPVYKNVFSEDLNKANYPISNKAYLLSNNKISTQIIGLANKQDFLSVYNSGKGTIYQFSSPLNNEYNNFMKHALFVPTLINIATSSIISRTPYYIIGADKKITTKYINSQNEITHIKGESIDIIPTINTQNGKQLLDYNNQITESGIYSVINNNLLKDKIAFNYNSKESKISSLSSDNLKDFIFTNNIKNMTVNLSEMNALKIKIKEEEFGKEYWKIAILLSLLFFGFEIILINLIKL